MILAVEIKINDKIAKAPKELAQKSGARTKVANAITLIKAGTDQYKVRVFGETDDKPELAIITLNQVEMLQLKGVVDMLLDTPNG